MNAMTRRLEDAALNKARLFDELMSELRENGLYGQLPKEVREEIEIAEKEHAAASEALLAHVSQTLASLQ